MSRLEEVKRAVGDMSLRELCEFREWFQSFEGEVWDRQIARDTTAGRLDSLAEETLTELREGRTRPL